MHLPAVLRGVVAAMWFGIQTYLGALALNGIGEYFLGFPDWFLWYAGFATVQVANTMLGIKSLERLASLAVPEIIAISIWMYFTLKGIAETRGLNIWTFRAERQASLIVLFIANLSFWPTMAIDIPNLTRFIATRTGSRSFVRRTRSIFLAQMVALPVTKAMIAGIGAVCFIGTGNWNPIEVIQGDAQGIALLVLLVVLAQWSTNNSANLAPRAITYRSGLVLAGIVGTLCFPWLILHNLFVFLGYYGAFLSAIGGIMVADDYLIRGRRLNVPALFDPDGQCRYDRGVNPAGLIAWLAAAAWWSSHAFVIGFPLGLVLYLALMRVLVLSRDAHAELGRADDYLAALVGMDWVHAGGVALPAPPALVAAAPRPARISGAPPIRGQEKAPVNQPGPSCLRARRCGLPQVSRGGGNPSWHGTPRPGTIVPWPRTGRRCGPCGRSPPGCPASSKGCRAIP